MEFIWRASQSLGVSSQVFTGAFQVCGARDPSLSCIACGGGGSMVSRYHVEVQFGLGWYAVSIASWGCFCGFVA